MIGRLLTFTFTIGSLAASAATLSLQPPSQTINFGATTTVDVQVSGLSANALGAFDLTILNDASIVSPTSIFFYSSLGVPASELTGSSLTSGTANGAETSFETTAALLALQGTQPFSLFRIMYTGVGNGTSLLSFALTPRILADGTGAILPITTVGTATITVVGTPEPSTFLLFGSGMVVLLWAFRRRFTA